MSLDDGNGYVQVSQNENADPTPPEGPSSILSPRASKVEDETAGENFDIPADAYGAAILALVRDVPLLRSHSGRWRTAVYNCVFGFGLLTVNLVVQLTLLYFVNVLVVKKDVSMVQNTYRDLRAKVYDDDGNFLQDLWDDYPDKELICNLGMTNFVFYTGCLLCWALTVLIEFRTNVNFFADLNKMPLVTVQKEQITEGDNPSVVGLTIASKLLIILFVVVPKMLICACLLWLGCQWLSATRGFESLVMNSVAMAFIVGTDEMLFEGVLPKTLRKEVQDLDFLVKQKENFSSDADLIFRYNRSILYFVAACIFVYIYPMYVQTVLPTKIFELEKYCSVFLNGEFRHICAAWGLGDDKFANCFT